MWNGEENGRTRVLADAGAVQTILGGWAEARSSGRRARARPGVRQGCEIRGACSYPPITTESAASMLFDYLAAVINHHTADYPTWVILSTSGLVVLLSWLFAEMGIFRKSKFVVKDKVSLQSSPSNDVLASQSQSAPLGTDPCSDLAHDPRCVNLVPPH